MRRWRLSAGEHINNALHDPPGSRIHDNIDRPSVLNCAPIVDAAAVVIACAKRAARHGRPIVDAARCASRCSPADAACLVSGCSGRFSDTDARDDHAVASLFEMDCCAETDYGCRNGPHVPVLHFVLQLSVAIKWFRYTQKVAEFRRACKQFDAADDVRNSVPLFN